MDQLLKEAELLRNEAELARAEHANQLLDVQAAAHRSKAAAEQREAALQVLHVAHMQMPTQQRPRPTCPVARSHTPCRNWPGGSCAHIASIGADQRRSLLALQSAKATAEQQHRAVAGHLQDTVTSLEAKLQAQKDLTDSHLELHARKVADLKAQIELAQVGVGRHSDRCVHHEHSARCSSQCLHQYPAALQSSG